ncbi:MAG TPA: SapC family protein, partial [Allosphingosinicella sp.]
MASQAPSNQLPLFYSSLEPLSSIHHEKHKMRAVESAPYLARAHVIPVTLDEFVACQRFYPIVFSTGENPVPLVL